MTSRRLNLLLVLMAALVALGSPTPSYAGFDEWLKGVMKTPGRHALQNRHHETHVKKKKVRRAKAADPMKQLRHRMVSGEELSEKQLASLVKNGDDLAAYKLAQKIEAGGDPDRLDDAMGYYVTAIKGGRDFAAAPVIKLLDAGVAADDPKLLERTETVLVAEATDHANVRDALIRMYRSGKPFGAEPQKADEMLIAAAEAGDAKAALDLAYAALTGVPNPAKIEFAKTYLAIAAKSEDLSIRTQAENILRGLTPGQPPVLTVASETSP
jgi:TPR repeat protein